LVLKSAARAPERGAAGGFFALFVAVFLIPPIRSVLAFAVANGAQRAELDG